MAHHYGYARGVAAVAVAVDATGVGIGLFVLALPLAAPLTMIVFLGALVPIAGTFVAGVLAVAATAREVAHGAEDRARPPPGALEVFRPGPGGCGVIARDVGSRAYARTRLARPLPPVRFMATVP